MSTEAGAVPRPYVLASVLTLLLATVASLAGLLAPGLYRDAEVLLPQLYGQDLLTLVVAVPALAVSLVYAARGSLRARVVWLGVTGYLLYTYATYAFMTAFNELYLVYVALFGLTLFVLVGGVSRTDAAALRAAVGDRSVRPYVAFQLLVAVVVGIVWLGEVVPASLAGTVPASLSGTGLPVNAVHTLDLGVVLPAFVLSAVWLARRRPWGHVFTGVLLVKATTLGLAVLGMIAFMLRDGQAVPLPQVVIFAGISLGGLVLTAAFLRRIGPDRPRSTAPPTTPAAAPESR